METQVMVDFEFETLRFELKGRIGTLTIHRPQALNALNSMVMKELHMFLDRVERHTQEIRALIVTGAGEKSFVAGADIAELSELSAQGARAFAETGQKVFRRIEVLPIPVLAAVNGFALGGGCELALSCDYIFSSTNAKFGLPEVGLGLIPGFGGTQRLARCIGLARARELIMTGRQISAQEAFEVGLTNRVVELNDLQQSAIHSLNLVLSKGPLAVAKAKEAINRGIDVDLDHGLMIERDLFSDLFRTSDQKEGTRAFLEKRAPQFSGE